MMPGDPTHFHDGLRRLLMRGDLASKLAPLPPFAWDPDVERAAPTQPARDPGLEMGPGAAPLPRPGALEEPSARALCLARFAHHELQAVELFAFALLRWPDLDPGLQRGLLGILADEQRHAAGYLERLEAHGARFAQFAPHSDYFWRHAPALDRPAAFLAAMGLTLEQANLDFTLLYRDAFAAAGDLESAALCQTVHDDEVRHVGFAARALRQLDPEPEEIARYERAVPFPLSAARAKGRRFERAPRERAGLGDAFIEHVRTARSSQERGKLDP